VPADWFDTDFLARLEALSVRVRRAARGSFLAHRQSGQTGVTGGVFADHRPYTPTDDYRHLDWHAIARHDALVVKRFEQERDVTVDLLVDTSASMRVGSPSKFDTARKLAAAVAYIALGELDRVTVTPFAAAPGAGLPPVRGKGQALTVLRFLADLRADGGPTDLAAAAAGFVAGPRRPGVVIAISDWFDPAGFRPALDRLRHHARQVEVVQLYSPCEADPQLSGEVELTDIERPGSARVTVSAAVRRKYREAFDGYRAELRAYCRTHGMGCAQAAADTPLDELLLNALREGGVLA
jgi:uncharacterized protein (DUF58 family)